MRALVICVRALVRCVRVLVRHVRVLEGPLATSSFLWSSVSVVILITCTCLILPSKLHITVNVTNVSTARETCETGTLDVELTGG